jgi:hypothetical protein
LFKYSAFPLPSTILLLSVRKLATEGVPATLSLIHSRQLDSRETPTFDSNSQSEFSERASSPSSEVTDSPNDCTLDQKASSAFFDNEIASSPESDSSLTLYWTLQFRQTSILDRDLTKSDSPEQQSKIAVGSIVGIVIGGLAGLVLIVLGILLLRASFYHEYMYEDEEEIVVQSVSAETWMTHEECLGFDEYCNPGSWMGDLPVEIKEPLE